MTLDNTTEVTDVPLADSVYSQLRDEIRSGRLPSGTPLAEKSLAENLKISRTPIREALRRLQEDGLVEIKHGRGAWVRAVSFREIIEVYEIRELVEPYAAHLAASNLSPDSARQLREMLDNFVEASRQPGISLRWQVDAKLHDVILEAAGNALLREMVWDLRMQTERAFTYMQESRLELFRQEHVQLINTILSGDGDAAEELMREHLKHAKASLTERRAF